MAFFSSLQDQNRLFRNTSDVVHFLDKYLKATQWDP